ncbi:MAG: hypothetical protein UT58_C0005G0014 [Microgenomates group bacterium GW2011_GWC1_39_7b]|uniref:Plasmid stabilization system n=3 Tax=Candidatus Woeseibacteriota TaxID=1752722 RepID=A0A0G0LM73_9BACT|nr:MAG: hypothetical protein UT17_C0003G0135 [Candidatus Woesebacteria bacterium GW2011_GWB1_39_10]KKR26838.1 MAG: hypothetical protein UT58_C0005G0014 [Microgenomates group bacterium GW2011_GWC1_39_7b]KKR73252.1 MAG: hypothetical protein UU16_C0026G0010 [Candidatus Woesebacteria bacterium GW2011_GWA2_40_7]KKS91072.1 MAG: hypothetical protein UV66_C0001G0429 [Candidatus Woesebacteria bacterium GW2011_GWA1_43_12]
MAYKVIVTKKTDKQLQKLSKIDVKRIVEKILRLSYPFPSNYDISKMAEAHDYFRLRVGTIRTIFEIDHDRKEIWIRKIKYRGQVYKK